jgi:NADH-quinone oxidoreductase subunit N
MNLTPPSVEYGLLLPMLIIFGVAVVGVLAEAFLPRSARYPTQLVLAIGGQLAALAAVIKDAVDLHATQGQSAAVGAIRPCSSRAPCCSSGC